MLHSKYTHPALALLAGMALSAEAMAQDTAWSISGNVALTTDYVFRGIDQSDEKAALQGGIDLGHDSGFFAGAWGSSVDFNDGDEASIELDLYAGFTLPVGGSELTGQVIYYAYPGAEPDYDFVELAVGFDHDFGPAAISLGLAWSPDYFAESGTGLYYSAGLSVPFGNSGFAADAGIGYQQIDDEAVFGTPDYVDYTIGISYSAGVFTGDLRWVGTDLDSNECFGGSDFCDDRLIFTLSAEF